MKRKISDLRLFNQNFLPTTGNRPAPTNDFPGFPREQIYRSITARFESQVRNHPDKIAVTVGARVVTYNALDEYANRTAHVILKSGPPGQIIALLFGQTIRMAIGLMGVLKAGKTYVPLDPAYPLDRLEYTLEDSQARVIVTDTANRKLAAALKDQVNKNILIVDINQIYSRRDIPGKNPGIPIHHLDPAYILYTSGSTGKPKGVIQSHRNVLHFTGVYTNALHIHNRDRLTLFSSYGFDAAQMDIYGALLNGAGLYPFDVKQENSLSLLVNLLREENITIFHSTPTLYRYFTDMLTGVEAFPHLRFIVLGGEPVFKKDVEKYRRFFPGNCLFINGLGPTESTVTLQYFIDKQSEITRGAVPVGFPVEETEVFIINEKGEKARVYELGEIVYKSDYLAWGYLNEPQFTAERFTPDPLTGKGRVYRSGDLGRRLEDGSIEYVGRKDFQVKIRGYRIEPAEIESKLDHFPGIAKSVVICQQNTGGENYLIAFYQAANGIAIDENHLVNQLKKSLPDYMIPAYFVSLEKIPLTPSGKIDRNGLPAPPLNNKEEYAAPQTPLEKKLAKIWAEILAVPLEKMSIHANFFDLGGHSLKAIQLAAKLEKQGFNFPINRIFMLPTISKMAEQINKTMKEKKTGIRVKEPGTAEKNLKNHLQIHCRLIRFNILKKDTPVFVLYIEDSDLHKIDEILEVIQLNWDKEIQPQYIEEFSKMPRIIAGEGRDYIFLSQKRFASLLGLKQLNPEESIHIYNKQDLDFNEKIMSHKIEKKYTIGSNQKLHLGVGTHNLELAIPFDTYLDRELLNRSVLHLVQRQGLMRSVLVHDKGKLVWQQHAAPPGISIPYLDISHFAPRDQEKILTLIGMEKSLKKFPTHSLLYRSIVRKDLLMIYLKKYFHPRSIPYRALAKIASLTKYLKKNCRKNSLLYRLLLVRKNLREHLFIIRLDHIIGDDTSMELIKNTILDYYHARVETRPQDITSYDRYIQQLNLGPHGITPKELCNLLAVDDYNRYSAIVSHHIDKTQTKKVHRFSYRYRFKDEGDLSEARAWDIGFILVILLCKALFNVPKIPAKLLYYGRNYGGKTYFNTVGESWDLIPLLIEVHEEEPLKMARRANELVQLASGNNINFVSMFLNEALYASWKEVIDLVAPARLTPPESMILIDFLGKRFDIREKNVSPAESLLSTAANKKLKKESYINTRNQGGFLIYVNYTSEALFIDIETLLKIDGKQLKQMIDSKIPQIETKIYGAR